MSTQDTEPAKAPLAAAGASAAGGSGTASAAGPRRSGPPGLPRRIARGPQPLPIIAVYMLVSVLIGLTYGFGFSAVSVNIYQIAGPIGSTTTEAMWLTAANLAPNVSLILLLFKVRNQFGIRKFAELAIIVQLIVSMIGLSVHSLEMALIVQFFSGVAQASLSSLTMIYAIDRLMPMKKLTVGISVGATMVTLGRPFTGIISPFLLDNWGVEGLYMVEIALTLLALAAIYLFPLQSPARKKSLFKLDAISFPCLAIGMGGFVIVWTVGSVYWWTEAPWLGWILVVSIIATTICAVIEIHRDEPFIDIRWLTSREMMQFIVALFLFRIVCSEQTTGAVGFLRQMGITNDQMVPFYVVILIATLLAGLTNCFVLKIGKQVYVKMAALLILCVGSWMNSHLTVLTRPEQMYFSQGLIGFASGLFMPAAMSYGMLAAFRKSFNHITSFICLFITTQKIGAMMGSSVFRTFITIREKFHSHSLVADAVMSNPNVAARVSAYGRSLGGVISDPTLRHAEGVAMLAKATSQQAYVLAYNDAFLAMAVLSAVGFCVLGADKLYQIYMSYRKTSATAAATA